MQLRKNPLYITFVALLMSVSTVANATECAIADSSIIGHIKEIHYNNDDYYPTFNLEEYPTSWMRMSPTYGLNTDYGMALYSLFLLAKSSGYKVQVACSSDGRVDELWVDVD